MMTGMIGSFTFKGIHTSDFTLVCKSIVRPLLPKKRLARKEIFGISGAMDFANDTYQLRQITMKIQYIGTDYYELRTRARQIAAWLYSDSWEQLIFDDEDDKYYLAKVTDEIELESLWESGSADIVFDCQPFAIGVDLGAASWATLPGTQVTANPGTIKTNKTSPLGSVFTITLVAAWTAFSVSCNGRTLTVNTPGSGTVVIDNVKMEVTLNGVNIFNQLSGNVSDFLEIIPGNNSILITGTGLSGTATVSYTALHI
jgi:predicted phage tail component-like protein